MDKWLLKFAHLFNPLFIRQGVDIDRMYMIVETKLMMDRRRAKVSWKQKRQKEQTNHMFITLAGYAFLGIFVGLVIAIMPSFLVAMIFAHTYLLFMMAMTLVTDFSAVLLDTTDNLVILPKPVNSKTIFMARMLHILLYILQFSLALSLVPVLITFFQYGFLTGLAVIFSFFLTILLAVFITYVLYLLVLRFSNEERVREIVTYFQIFMAIFFMVGFQVLPRLINFDQISTSFTLNWYSYLLPPVWMSLAVEAVQTHHVDMVHGLMLILVFAVPLLSFYFLLSHLAPSFSRKLALMNQDASNLTRKTSVSAGNRTFQSFPASICCRKILERNSFEMTWIITARDKGFRLQFYPGLGYMIVFIFIFVLGGGSDISSKWASLPYTNKYLWLIYIPLYSIANGIGLLSYNEDYQASWIYHGGPVSTPGELITGSAKALFVKYFMLAYFAMFALALSIWGWRIGIHFVYGLFNNFLCFLILITASKHYLPFSRKPGPREQSGSFLMILLESAVIAVLVGLHYLLLKIPLLLYVVMPIVAATCWLLLK
ncbi:MAG TPA: hypothetical protein VK543_13060, partial [Puia sp.]|nr:hypothetical protein [Puia sp.]